MKDEYDFSEGKRGQIVDATGKTRITIWLDDDVISAFKTRAETEGKGYQTLVNEALKEAIRPESAVVTVESLRRILKEELSTV